jgi:hypothetical protein
MRVYCTRVCLLMHVFPCAPKRQCRPSGIARQSADVQTERIRTQCHTEPHQQQYARVTCGVSIDKQHCVSIVVPSVCVSCCWVVVCLNTRKWVAHFELASSPVFSNIMRSAHIRTSAVLRRFHRAILHMISMARCRSPVSMHGRRVGGLGHT